MTSDRLSFQFTRILGLNQKSMTKQEAAMLEAGGKPHKYSKVLSAVHG